MAEHSNDTYLEQLLTYQESPPADSNLFTVGVMQQVRKEQRTRRLILILFGTIGALFGLIGASMLAGAISWVFTEALSPMLAMQLVLFFVAASSFYIWIMNDDLALEN